MKRVTLVLFFVLFPIFIFAQQNNWKIFNVNNTGYPYADVNDLLLDSNHNGIRCKWASCECYNC